MTIAFICSFIYYQYFRYRHVKIVKATCRKWIRCARNGDVITYRIQIFTKRPSDVLTLDELWIDDRLYRVRVLHPERMRHIGSFSEKEMLFLEAEREAELLNYEEMLPSNRGKVSLGYLINNKRKYLSIKGFEEHTSPLKIAS